MTAKKGKVPTFTRRRAVRAYTWVDESPRRHLVRDGHVISKSGNLDAWMVNTRRQARSTVRGEPRTAIETTCRLVIITILGSGEGRKKIEVGRTLKQKN